MQQNHETPEQEGDTIERDGLWQAFRRLVESMMDPARAEECLGMFAPDAVGIGMNEQAPCFDREDIGRILSDTDTTAVGISRRIEYGRHSVLFHPPSTGSVVGVLTVIREGDGGPAASEVTALAGFRRIDGEWRVSSIACSPLSMSRENVQAHPPRFTANAREAFRSEVEAEAADLFNSSMPGGVVCFFERTGFPLHFVNPHMLEYLGYAMVDFQGDANRKFLTLVHLEDRLELTTAIRSALDMGNEYEITHRLLRKDGGAVWVVHRGRRAADDSGLLIGVFTDITEIIGLQDELREQARLLAESREAQKKQEERLQTAMAAAEEAAQLKTFFLANMSHEIRTPMNGVVGFVELALADGDLPPKTREYLDKIKQSADGLLGVINDILDISKIESGKMEVEHTAFRLGEVIRQCESITGIRAAEKGVQLVFRHDGEENPSLYGDPTRLRQILLNLLSNAVKFTERGVISLTTKVASLADKRARVSFEVADTGIGLTREQVERIFQPFVQADASTTRRHGGTGLGLSLTKTFIDLMGGELRVESSPGVGSRFSFTLEFDAAEALASDTWVLARSGFFKAKRPLFSGRVLVCEDNEISRDVIIGHLARCGLEADVAENGLAGVDMAEERLADGTDYDLVFMDIYMPVMDGLEATRQLRRLGVRAPIVALTANVMKKDRERYLRGGLTAYLAKPFVSEELWACLTRFLKPDSWVANDTGGGGAAADGSPAVHRELGLSHTGGDTGVYRRIAGDFIRSFIAVDDDIRRAFDAGQTEEAKRLAHTLKGVAATLGAERLAAAAQALETVLSENAMGRVDAVLRTFSAELQPALIELRELAPERRRERASEQDVAAAGAVLDKLAPLLESCDPAAFELLAGTEKVLAPLGERVTLLRQLVETADFGGAAKAAREIIDGLKR